MSCCKISLNQFQSELQQLVKHPSPYELNCSSEFIVFESVLLELKSTTVCDRLIVAKSLFFVRRKKLCKYYNIFLLQQNHNALLSESFDVIFSHCYVFPFNKFDWLSWSTVFKEIFEALTQISAQRRARKWILRRTEVRSKYLCSKTSYIQTFVAW